MTVQRLSAGTVKVQLSAEELDVFLPASARNPDSPQMLRLISFMLAKAEAASGIPFSSLPVTVELLGAEDGSLAAYFTAQREQSPPADTHQPRIIRLAARFAEEQPLRQCCALLYDQATSIRNSMLYRYRQQWVLFLKLKRENASVIHHILAEHGSPYRLSVLGRARLSEYGTCMIEKDAIQKLLQNISLRSE